MYVCVFSSEFGDIVIAWKQPVQSYKIVYCEKKTHTCYAELCMYCYNSASGGCFGLSPLLLLIWTPSCVCGPCFFLLFCYTPVMYIYCTGHSHVSCLHNFLIVVTVQASAFHSVFTSPLIDLYRPLSFTGFCLYRFISSVGATAFVVFTGLDLCRPLSVHAPVFVLIRLSSGLEQILGLSSVIFLCVLTLLGKCGCTCSG